MTKARVDATINRQRMAAFTNQFDVIYFFYGLAFFIAALLGSTLVRRSRIPLPWFWLIGFFLTHGIYEWLHVLAFSAGDGIETRTLKQIAMTVSFLMLAEFGRSGIGAPAWVRLSIMTGMAVVVVWARTAAIAPFDETIRYGLALPGAWLAAYALWRAGRRDPNRRALHAAATLIALYGVATVVRNTEGWSMAASAASGLLPLSLPFPIEIIRGGCIFAIGTILHRLVMRETLAGMADVPFTPPRPYTHRFFIAIPLVLSVGWLTVEWLGDVEADNQRQHLVNRARSVAALLQHESLRQLTATRADIDTRLYRETRARLTAGAAANPDINSIYLYRRSGTNFVFFAGSHADQPHTSIEPGDAYEGEVDAADLAFFDNGEPLVTRPFRDRWGYWVSASAPVLFDPDTGRVAMAVGVDIEAGAFIQRVRLFRLGGIVLTALIVGILLEYFRQHRRLWQEATALAYSEAKVRKFNETLESRVRERTDEIDRQNRLLQQEMAGHRTAEQAAREAENRYRTLTEQLPAITYAVELLPEPRTVYISPQVREMFGYSDTAWLGEPSLWINVIHPDDREHVLARIAQHNRTGDPFHLEYRSKHAAGHAIWIRNIARYNRDEQGRIAHVHGVMFDITHERRMEEEQIKAQKLESLGLLAGGIAHDFNNFLTGILGNLSLLREQNPMAPLTRELLREAEEASLRARELTQQLLTFAKGGAPLKRRHRLGAIVEDVASFALRGAHSRPVITRDGDEWPVHVDPGQIGQVIQNLVLNADQSMPGGGTITLHLRRAILEPHRQTRLAPGRYMCLDVIDHGAGIAAENLLKIFDPYFTTKPQGSGLGLTTAHAILRKHGGDLVVQSTPGKGSTFTLYLPAAENEPETPPRETAGDNRRHHGGNRRVLVMDDEPSLSTLARRILEQHHYRVDTQPNGCEAIIAFQDAIKAGDPYAAVILDLTIPGGVGGEETLSYLKKIDPAVRAIVSSGYATGDVMARHREHGFIGAVPKPYTARDLVQAVAEALETDRQPA